MPMFKVKVECSATWSAEFDVIADSAEEAEAEVTPEEYGKKLIDEMFYDDIRIEECKVRRENEDGEEESGN